jgi:putative sterol carrier protein
MGVDSLVLSFRTMFDSRAAEGLAARYELRLGEDRFRAEIAGGRFEIFRGSAEQPDAIIETDPATLAGLVYGDRALAEALRSGDLKVTDDHLEEGLRTYGASSALLYWPLREMSVARSLPIAHQPFRLRGRPVCSFTSDLSRQPVRLLVDHRGITRRSLGLRDRQRPSGDALGEALR